jgi:hypothetical protein
MYSWAKQIVMTDILLRIYSISAKVTVKRLRDQTELIIYEAINTKDYECVTAALVYQHANSIFSTQLHLLPVWLLQYFSTLSHCREKCIQKKVF